MSEKMACLNPEDIQTKRVFDTKGVFPTFQAHRGGGESGAILSKIKTKCVRRVADGRLADCSACSREVTGGTDGSAAVVISKSKKEQ